MTLPNKNPEVTKFLEGQNHPLHQEIELLRECILTANANLTENIKWNGPNYCFAGEDRITMKINPPKLIQLIFHRGAKVKEQPKEKLLAKDFGLLEWRGNDRAIATFRNKQDIESRKSELMEIVSAWIKATE
ncbi:MAG: DUF1801 domain-containing protein [Bacteroidales bacterium]|nr:DUF1801 domain-containing protein [Bacteroidales bacterium]